MSLPRIPRHKLWFLLPLVVLAVAAWLWQPWRRPIVIRERINPRDGAVMVWVPAGDFRMGRDNREEIHDAARQRDWSALYAELRNSLGGKATSDDQPLHTVSLDGYWIYKYEVTVAQYRAFCRATKRAMPPKPPWGWHDDHPITCITWHDATAYATWAGASLPTEAEWEKAARGPNGRIYPWGNSWDSDKCCNSAGKHVARSPSLVGSFPEGASPYGALDMAGNVFEWCADWYDDEYYHHALRRNPTGPVTGTTRVVRGECWLDNDSDFYRAASRSNNIPTNRYYYYGFRCVSRSPGP